VTRLQTPHTQLYARKMEQSFETPLPRFLLPNVFYKEAGARVLDPQFLLLLLFACVPSEHAAFAFTPFDGSPVLSALSEQIPWRRHPVVALLRPSSGSASAVALFEELSKTTYTSLIIIFFVGVGRTPVCM